MRPSSKKPGVPRVMISLYPDHIRKLNRLAPIFIWPYTACGRFACRGLPIIRHDRCPWKMSKAVTVVACVVRRKPGLGFM